MTKFLTGVFAASLFMSDLPLGPAGACALFLLTFWGPLSELTMNVTDGWEIDRIRREAARGMHFSASAELAYRALRGES